MEGIRLRGNYNAPLFQARNESRSSKGTSDQRVAESKDCEGGGELATDPVVQCGLHGGRGRGEELRGVDGTTQISHEAVGEVQVD